MTAIDLGEARWPEVAEGHPWLAVPLGSTEQHGPHLPLGTDTAIAAELADRLAADRPAIRVAPPLPYGASGEHAGFPGTLSIGGEVLELVLVELGRSADHFAGLILVNCHGGNAAAAERAAARLRAEGRRCHVWHPPRPAPPGDGPAWAERWDAHAGFVETSVALALYLDGAEPGDEVAGNPTPLAELGPLLRRHGVGAVSPSGVLGDPAGASVAAGRWFLDQWSAALRIATDGWVADAPDR